MVRSRKSDLRPGQRLQRHVQAWEKFETSRVVRSLVKHGYKMDFVVPPKLTGPNEKFATRLPAEQMKIVRAEVAGFLKKGAVRKLSLSEARATPGYYSKLFCVPKPGNKWRMIIDMRGLNSCILKHGFKMQGVKDVRNLLTPGMFGGVIDISDAYYHISVHKSARRYCRFILDGVVYEYLGLPMGLSCSPRIFTRVSKAAADWLRKRGVLLVIYIDDILVLGTTREEYTRNVNMVLSLLKKLGFVINESKCQIEPSNKFTYLGCVWNTADWKVQLKENRAKNLRSSATALVEKGIVTLRSLAQFIGRVQSAVGIVPLAKARTRAVLFQFSAVCKTKEDYSKSVTLSTRALRELKAWTQLSDDASLPISTQEMAVESVDTDASLYGYGWYWKNEIFSDSIPELWSQSHINILELWTLRQFLTTAGAELSNINLCWRVDNNTALAAIRK